jgi:hypothetical protein
MYRGSGQSEQRRAVISARYRRNVLLGGRVLAKQWRKCATEPPTERDEQRKRMRSCLRPQLQRELEPHADDACELAALLAEPETADDDLYLRLREVFARYALSDSRAQRRHLRRRFFDRRSTLTPATVQLTEECIKVRLDFVRKRLGDDVSWPPTAATLDERIRVIERGWLRSARSFRHWHEHYNAACAYALPLIVASEDAPATALAQRAVERLRLANARADSAYIASRRDWLVSEDPDLMGLRAWKEFAEFELMHLPSSTITPRRPRKMQELESSRYVRSLLVTAAGQWQAIWRARRAALNGGPDIGVLLEWFGDELRSWEAVSTVACHYRHSGSRLTLIRNLQNGASRYGRPQPAVGFPLYERDPLDGALAREPVDAAARREINNANTRLDSLRAMVEETPHDAAAAILADLKRWRTTLRRLDAAARPSSPYLLGLLCDHHAALWQLLGQWVQADEPSADRAERDFRAQVKRTRRLWRVVYGVWPAVSDAVEASRNGNGSARLQPIDVVRVGAASAWWRARIARGDRRSRARHRAPSGGIVTVVERHA